MSILTNPTHNDFDKLREFIKIVKVLNNNKFLNNNSITDIYKCLYDKINNSQNSNNIILFELWINYITQHLINTTNILNQCTDFLNTYDYHDTNHNSNMNIQHLNNHEIKHIYQFMYSEKRLQSR